jgi:UDP-N-acetylmuramoyl-L-alanyl-D-glutamate--2,6-diaminopimelate ligase
MTQLAALLPDCDVPASAGSSAVAAIACDSRAVTRGAVFFAVPGTQADGLSFASAAIANGAIAVVAERAPSQDIGAPVIVVPDVRAALSRAAARFYPRQPDVIAAITGTSGKTSVASFVRQIWAQQGQRAAALGTTGLVGPDGATSASLTTPDPITLHRSLDEVARRGVTHLAMEASSHGLDQRRLDAVRLTTAGFTNLSRDHLDYHRELEDYFAAKMRLFEDLLKPGQTAVVDADGEFSARVSEICKRRGLKLMTTGRNGVDLRLISQSPRPDATDITIEAQGCRLALCLPLAGDFMISNALVAAGLCIAAGSDVEASVNALASLKGAPGRLEKIGTYKDAPIFVDYAHKPDALEKVLAVLRPLATGKLVVVFGCGGNRDAGKRPIMGEIAARLADVVIITDDNPRSENPADIRAAIKMAVPDALEIADRAQAIAEAVGLLERGDVLLVAGKGHETGQIFADRTVPFSDHEAVRAALQDRTA